MNRRRLAVIVGIVVAIANFSAASPTANPTHGGTECGQNPMQPVQLVSQKTGKFLRTKCL